MLKVRPPSEAQERYTNGNSVNYKWIAETGDRTCGFLPRDRVNKIMGYEPGYSFRGFNGGKGIMKLKPAVYNALDSAFKVSARQADQTPR